MCADKYHYISCEHLEYNAVFFEDCIRICCGDKLRRGSPLLPKIPICDLDIDDIDTLFSRFLQYKQRLVREINTGKQTFCAGCEYLREKTWTPSETLKLVNFSTDYRCNLRCSYCYHSENGYNYINRYDIFKLISNVLNSKYVSKETQYIYACGEIGVHPKAQSIIGLFTEHNVSFFTNSTQYFDSIHQLIIKPHNSILVSIDCGTKKTYQVIKGRDCFDNVCENLCRYAQNDGNVILKYILTDGNIDQENLNGFIDFCLKANIHNIRISYDWNMEKISNKIRYAAMILLRKAKKYNLNCYVDDSFLCD